jgi:ribonuclease HI
MDTIYTDGSCLVNPGGPGGWGFVMEDDEGEVCRHCGGLKKDPTMTNNVAEYIAVIKAIKHYEELGRPGPLRIRSDSKMLVNQLSGEWGVKGGSYRKFWQGARALVEKVSFEIIWEWVPREQNEVADALSKQGSTAARESS